MERKIFNGLRLYALTLVFPITLTIINILFVGILGVETKEGFLMNFKVIWIDYYFTGDFLGFIAWRWHLMLLVISIVAGMLDDM